jgi:hypothetical protein
LESPVQALSGGTGRGTSRGAAPPRIQCETSSYLQQVGHWPQQVSPQQVVPQHSLQHVGHLSQHSVPQQACAVDGAGDASVNPAKLETDRTAAKSMDFMG